MSHLISNIIVSPTDPRVRTTLKSATQHSGKFKSGQIAQSTSHAIAILEGAQFRPIDIIFLEYGLGDKELTEFFNKVKEMPHCENTQSIVVFSTDHQSSRNVSKVLVAGADSVLLEPFSVFEMDELGELTHKLLEDDSAELAFTFLSKELVKLVDSAARSSTDSNYHKAVMKEIGELMNGLTNLSEERLEKHQEALIEAFIKAGS